MVAVDCATSAFRRTGRPWCWRPSGPSNAAARWLPVSGGFGRQEAFAAYGPKGPNHINVILAGAVGQRTALGPTGEEVSNESEQRQSAIGDLLHVGERPTRDDHSLIGWNSVCSLITRVEHNRDAAGGP
jgi:hypothetical protein